MPASSSRDDIAANFLREILYAVCWCSPTVRKLGWLFSFEAILDVWKHHWCARLPLSTAMVMQSWPVDWWRWKVTARLLGCRAFKLAVRGDKFAADSSWQIRFEWWRIWHFMTVLATRIEEWLRFRKWNRWATIFLGDALWNFLERCGAGLKKCVRPQIKLCWLFELFQQIQVARIFLFEYT